MNDKQLYRLKFPIGQFNKPNVITENHIKEWIKSIAVFPESVIEITKSLNEDQLNYNYRPEGWTIKQVVHHCADSHMNSINRFKLALTEDTPTIRPYFENRFAELVDYTTPINDSILILKGVHAKLTIILSQLTAVELKKEFIHPEHNTRFTLEETIGNYAWHSNHHLAHIKQALKHKGVFN